MRCELRTMRLENKRLQTILNDLEKSQKSSCESKHIEDYLYDMEISEKDEAILVIDVNGVEHTVGLLEKDIDRLKSLFNLRRRKAEIEKLNREGNR